MYRLQKITEIDEKFKKSYNRKITLVETHSPSPDVKNSSKMPSPLQTKGESRGARTLSNNNRSPSQNDKIPLQNIKRTTLNRKNTAEIESKCDVVSVTTARIRKTETRRCKTVNKNSPKKRLEEGSEISTYQSKQSSQLRIMTTIFNSPFNSKIMNSMTTEQQRATTYRPTKSAQKRLRAKLNV